MSCCACVAHARATGDTGHRCVGPPMPLGCLFIMRDTVACGFWPESRQEHPVKLAVAESPWASRAPQVVAGADSGLTLPGPAWSLHASLATP
eukprot:1333195-Alexandrium_andersonii.AAC.1